MRTRSSRFFVILLHLVGVSHNPSWIGETGIIAVLPWPVALERVDLYAELHRSGTSSSDNDSNHEPAQTQDDGDDNKRRKRRRDSEKEQHHHHHQQQPNDPTLRPPSTAQQQQQSLLLETATTLEDSPPVWLQDTADGSCLGPTGSFSECGDATLWFVERQTIGGREDNKKHHHGRDKLSLLAGGLSRMASLPWSSFSKQQNHQQQTPSLGLVFRVVDRDYKASTEALRTRTAATSTGVPATAAAAVAVKETRRQRKERQKRSECLDASAKDSSWAVDVQSCAARRRSGGLFVWNGASSSKTKSSAVWVLREDGVLQPAASSDRYIADNGDETEFCLARNPKGQAVLEDCEQETAVQFSFLRYRAVAVPTMVDGLSPMDEVLKPQPLKSDEVVVKDKDGEPSMKTSSSTATEPATNSNLPESRDRAHTQAFVPAIHPKLKISAGLVPAMHPELTISPGLVFSLEYQSKTVKAPKKAATKRKGPLDALLSNTNPILLAGQQANRQRRQRTTPPPSTTFNVMLDDYNSPASKVRRMQRHPYLTEAKGGIWTCPQTGLEYQTDLHKYLGWNRKERGRHTLTGVGIYRKGFVIKVYGIGFYISKRDVLADASFEPFASLTADRLRDRPDFYELLRSRERALDRTIMLKTNMQLSTDTMRSSLGADWSYLTDESKALLVEFSTVPRPADDTMLEIIQSPENPSRCSCSQVAPPEYNADPDCCARGTELVFTWTKENELEVRLNGRLMETFARPDIAEGIFYEYLRHDDPISPELRDKVVDGFPFLLGPLAQVRGVNIGKNASHKSAGHINPLMTLVGGLTDSIRSHAVYMAGAAKHNTAAAAEHASKVAKDLGDSAKDLAKELERKREAMVKISATALPMAMKMLSRDPETVEAFSKWLSDLTGHEVVEPEDEPEEEVLLIAPSQRAPRGRVFGYPVSRWFGEDYHAPDEIGPLKIHPTINKIILALVHLYLLLLFIVSFPGSYSTRTKLVVRRSCKSRDSFGIESDSSLEAVHGKNCLDELTNNMKQRKTGRDGRRRQNRGRNGDLSNVVTTTANSSGLQKKSQSYFLK